MRTAAAVFFALIVSTGLAAAAETPPPNRVRGTIASIAGDAIKVKEADGMILTISLPADVRVTALENRKLTDIKGGDYVGAAAVAGPDGKLHAQQVLVFAESMRGAGEGHRPMSAPNQTMTNATVATVLADPAGTMLRLTYAGGEQDIEVGPDARVAQIVPGDRSLLKDGARVAVFVVPQTDGSLVARSIQAEKDGVPPL